MVAVGRKKAQKTDAKNERAKALIKRNKILERHGVRVQFDVNDIMSKLSAAAQEYFRIEQEIVLEKSRAHIAELRVGNGNIAPEPPVTRLSQLVMSPKTLSWKDPVSTSPVRCRRLTALFSVLCVLRVYFSLIPSGSNTTIFMYPLLPPLIFRN
ncbi:hypothetical protein K470DRAFT_290274 [Piedraia hortae CBS 480.64]|uniref:Uncharacterized protein n=1 Tax=Piedraia hortae CBS 480.64 TaxID=1314780 RepID=A0A6A7BT66_9PEZI|nr:hypothetical protein K470DRAFT_290274 [Piedraia hortae CBS 480.64]